MDRKLSSPNRWTPPGGCRQLELTQFLHSRVKLQYGPYENLAP